MSGDEAQTLERELARELPAGHVLKAAKVRAVARRLDPPPAGEDQLDRDDVAFYSTTGEAVWCT